MSRTLSPKIAPFVENIAESSTACLLTMVQGNVLALTLSHWLIASETGLVAGAVTSAALLAAGARRRWIVALALGAVTAVVDFAMHPGMFGPLFFEAAVTGLGAAALSWLVGAVVARFRRRAPVSA